jgi:hypothetical protein
MSSTASAEGPASTASTTAGGLPTTTADPGTLPQTQELPSSGDPLFEQHVAGLLRAVATGDTSYAAPFFFPLSAYVQVKGISDPVHDYETRLIPDYRADIEAIHERMGVEASSAALTGVDVPTSAAQWILPGTEYNKGSYWRVYGTVVHYELGGSPGSFEITSMISWRGEWYVVHLGAIR